MLLVGAAWVQSRRVGSNNRRHIPHTQSASAAASPQLTSNWLDPQTAAAACSLCGSRACFVVDVAVVFSPDRQALTSDYLPKDACLVCCCSQCFTDWQGPARSSVCSCCAGLLAAVNRTAAPTDEHTSVRRRLRRVMRPSSPLNRVVIVSNSSGGGGKVMKMLFASSICSAPLVPRSSVLCRRRRASNGGKMQWRTVPNCVRRFACTV